MERDEKIEFTVEGFKRVEDSLTFISEEKRHSVMVMTVNNFLM